MSESEFLTRQQKNWKKSEKYLNKENQHTVWIEKRKKKKEKKSRKSEENWVKKCFLYNQKFLSDNFFLKKKQRKKWEFLLCRPQQ